MILVFFFSSTLTRVEPDSSVSGSRPDVEFRPDQYIVGTDSVIFRISRITVEAALPVAVLCVSLYLEPLRASITF
jgi:hypothetical protein